MAWWVWVLAGLVLLAVELLTPGGFVVIFFGAAALTVGALSALGMPEVGWLQATLFAVLSVGSLVLFRQRLLDRVARHAVERPVDSLVGAEAIALDTVPAGAVGRGELRGTSWTIRNAGSAALAPGQRCRVDRVDGLTLWVSAVPEGRV